MPRSRALLTAPIVLAIVLIGVFAIRSRGNDSDNLDTTERRGCAPVARADAVATKPATPVSIDVLDNDTDADGDALVFQILKTTGGESTVDDGGTPTDASDDRVLFTPSDPAPEKALIEYQAVDPDGAISESIVNVIINAEGALPLGTQSDAITEAGPVGDTEGNCATPGTSTTGRTGTTFSPSSPNTGGTGTTLKTTKTTAKKKKQPGGSTSGRTTTTRRSQTTTTRGSGSNPTTPPTQPPPPATTQPTSPPPTEPPGPPPTTPPSCGPFPSDGTDEEQDAWKQCVRENS